MNTRNLKNTIIFILPIIYIFAYKLFIFENYTKSSEMITASFMIILLSLSIFLLGFRKCKSSFASENALRVVLLYLLGTFTLMYGVGFFVGFLKNAYSRDTLTLINNIFSPIVVIITMELIRYVVIWANKDKKYILYIFTIILILFELATTMGKVQLSDLNSFEPIFRLTCSTILPIIIKNAVLSYLCYYVGYKIPLIYHLVMDVYIFLVPVVPDLGEYLNSLIIIALPVLIYINVSTFIDDSNKQSEFKLFDLENFNFMDIPTFVFFAIFAGLISGLFPLYMIGIGSESMSPQINKGDAVIILKTNGKNLKKGDIISFANNGTIVVHRINEITKKNNKRVYVTKGDANNSTDGGVVPEENVRGVVKCKIPFIAWPTVWLSELIKN